MKSARSNNKDEHWSRYYKSGKDFMAVTSQEIRRILSYVPSVTPRTALDIGCGTGQLTRELYHGGYRVVGVDAAKSAIEIAQSLTTVPVAKLRYIHQDFEAEGLSNLPFSPYELITCRYVYAFVSNKIKFLSEVQDVLAESGVFVVISPLNDHVPEHKKEIAVNPRTTLIEFKKYFEVDYYEELGDGFFICRNKDRRNL